MEEEPENATDEVIPPVADETPSEVPHKSSSTLLEEIFDILSESSKKKKSKHKKKDKHKKKKKHKDSDREKKDRKKHKDKSSSKKEDKTERSENFYELTETKEIAKNLDTGVKFNASKCDFYPAGELDSEEEKALSFDYFVEKESADFTDVDKNTKKRSSSASPEHESFKRPKIEIKDLKKCSVTELLTADKKEGKRPKKYEDGELSSSSDEISSSSKKSKRSHHDKDKKYSPRDSKSSSSRDRHSSRELSSRHESSSSSSKHDRDRRSNRESESSRSSRREPDRLRDDRSRSSTSDRGQRQKMIDRRREERIDKKKLLAIAKKNATYILKEQQERMLQAGVISGSVSNKPGKSVAELTEYCKKLVNSGSGSSDSDSDSELSAGDGPTESFIHHPFQLRDRPNTIVMNIRNATQLPTKSMQEKAAESSKIRSLQYPVSSGQQHRSTEWIPVSPTRQTASVAPSTSDSGSNKPKPSAVVAAITASCTDASGNIDISSVISQKLSAMRKITESGHTPAPGFATPFHLASLSGAFTGSTGVKPLTPAELASGQQAWARKDQLKTAAPVAGGMGMKLLQKMGWRPGEGLGKNKEGGLEPLNLDVKMDKKGLVASEECRTRFQPFSGTTKKKGGPGVAVGAGGVADAAPDGVGHEVFSGKHPVSALVELCTKRRWGSPVFELVFESGPDHKKNFLFKVKVNEREFQDQIAYGNKKQAKAMAAQHCLLQLGLAVKI